MRTLSFALLLATLTALAGCRISVEPVNLENLPTSNRNL